MVGEQDKTEKVPVEELHGRGEHYIVRMRKEYIRERLARGEYDEQIVSKCLESSLFRHPSGKWISRSSIRRHYLWVVKAERRSRPLSGPDLIRDTADRLMCVFRVAMATGKLHAANQSQKHLMRLFGLRHSLPDLLDEMDVRRQTEAMDWSIAPPKWEEENGDDNDNDNDGDKA
jgi:hypothetical protein